MSAKQVIGLVIVALALVGSFVVPAVRPGSSEPTGPTHGCEGAQGEADREATLCLLNAERRLHGLRALRENADLARAARRNAEDIAAREYSAHRSPERTTPHERIRAAGYRAPRLTGENLAKGEREAGAPSSIVDGWMHSPGHRANILRAAFEEIGVAIAADGDVAIYVTTFGARR